MGDKLRIVLATRVKPPDAARTWTDERLISWINAQVDGAPDLMVRRALVAEALEFMRAHSMFASAELG